MAILPVPRNCIDMLITRRFNLFGIIKEYHEDDMDLWRQLQFNTFRPSDAYMRQ